MSKHIGLILGLLAIFGTSWGVWSYLGRYALCADLKAVEQRLDYKIVSDQSQSIQQRIWTLEDRYKGRQMPPSVLEEYRKLLEEKKKAEYKMMMLEKAEEKK